MAIIELKGLKGLNSSDRDAYVKDLTTRGVIDNTWTDNEIDRVYRNKQFADKFGTDAFYNTPNPELRDTLFRNAILAEELERFRDDPNLQAIENMTPEGQQELFESGYLSEKELSKEVLQSDNLSDAQKDQASYVSNWGIVKEVGAWAASSAFIGSGIGGIFGAVGAVPGFLIGGAVGAVVGLGKGIYDKLTNSDNIIEGVKTNNSEIFDKVYAKDVNRKRNSTEVQSESSRIKSDILARLSDGSMSYDDVDSIFESIVGNHGTDDDPNYGSNHYAAFKDSYLKDIEEGDKIKVVSDFLAMQKYHPNDALFGIDQIFQNMVADRQGAWVEWGLTLKRNVIGLCNDIAQIPTDAVAFTIDALYGPEAAEKYLNEGKIGNLDLGMFGPAYWHKAAKYNVFSQEAIDRAEKFGGISEGSVIREVDSSIWNINTILQENVGQMHYLAYYALAGRLFGRFGKKIDMTSKMGTAYRASAVIVPNLSMSAQMGYEAYENTHETLMDRYQDILAKTTQDIIDNGLDDIDWNSELQDYKNKHSREGERILMPDDQLIDMLKQQKAAELAEAATSDILKEVTSQSMDAFRMESVMDLAKNSINIQTFRSYIYNNNRALQSSIRNRQSNIMFNGNRALDPTKPKHLFIRSAFKQMAEEGKDEYIDGITTGIAEGYNVAQFDGWLLNRENPGTVDNASMSWRAMCGMAMGIRNAFNEDNIYEATLGAMSPWMPLFNRGSRKPKFDENGNPVKTKSYFFTNAIYEDYVSELYEHEEAKVKVARINEFLDNNADRIENIAYLDAPNKLLSIARLTGDEKIIKDAEQLQLIELAQLINSAQENASGAAVVKQMTETLQALADGSYSDADARQLGTEFISQPENKNSGMTVEEGYERMRHNAKKLLEASKKLKEVEAAIDKSSKSKDLSAVARQHLINLAFQQDDWKTRLSQISKDLSISTDRSSLSINDMANYDDASQYHNEVVSHRESVTKNIENITNEIKQLEIRKKATKNDNTLSNKERKDKIASLDSKIAGYNQAKAQLAKEEVRLKSLEKQASRALSNWEDSEEVLSADQIMGLSAAKIQYMIENKSKYNVEQQAQIDEAINKLSKDPDYLTKLEDAARISQSLEESERTKAAIYDGPQGYNVLTDRLKNIKKEEQARRENARYENQVYMSWDSMSSAEILKDATEREGLSLLKKYANMNNFSRYEEIQKIIEVADLQDSLISFINKDDKVEEAALADSIKDITTRAKTKDEAIALLNTAVNDDSIPINVRDDIRNLLELSNVLDNATDVTFKQEKEEISRKEAKRAEEEAAIREYEAYQLAEAERMADEEAARRAQPTNTEDTLEDNGQEVSEEIETIPDSGQEVAEEVEEIADDGREVAKEVEELEVGREPVEQVDEELVDLEDKLNIEYSPELSQLPITTDQVIEEQLDTLEKEGVISDTFEENLEDAKKTGNAQEGELVGNSLSRYRERHGTIYLREDYEKIEGNLKAQFEWLDSANIKYQEVIDNELKAISELDPEVKILKVNPKFNATNDAVMRNINLLVVEYTDEIAEIHKSDDSILKADGKKWLVIGALGYNRNLEGNYDKFKNLTYDNTPMGKRFGKFWRNNPNERFHVDTVANTRISRINPGRIVNEDANHAAGTQSISKLLDTVGLEIEDAKWAIAKNDSYKIIGGVAEEQLLLPNSNPNSGAIYLLVPSANGKYFITYLNNAFTDTLTDGSELKNIINNALIRLASPSHKERYKALLELFQYIHLDKDNNNILIGTEDNNTLTIIQGGESKTYNLDNHDGSVVADLLKVHFMINVNPGVLLDKSTLSLYDEGGALLTSVQKYGASAADFTVYEMDSNGNPNIPESAFNSTSLQTGVKGRIKAPTVLYNTKLYSKEGGIWKDSNKNIITNPDEIRHLEYLNEIKLGKKELSSTNTHNQYVFSYDRNNPIVISVNKNNGKLTELSKEEAIEYLDKQERLAEEKAREKAIQEALENSFEADETIDLDSDIDLLDNQQTLGFEEFLLGDNTIEEVEEAQEEELEDENYEFEEPELDPNKLVANPIGTGATMTVDELMITYMDRFLEVISEKVESGEWSDFPDDDNEAMLKYFEEKGIQTMNISDVDAWFDKVKNCT